MKLKTDIQRYLVSFGERLALIPLIILFAFIFTIERATEANAQQIFIKQNYKFDGLVVLSGTLENIAFSKSNEEETSLVTTDVPHNLSYSNTISVEIESIRVPITPTPTKPPVIETSGDIWEKIALCESRGNWSINTGNGYFGGLQFSQGAWSSVGGTGVASDHTKEEQISRGQMLQAIRGWGVWGDCAKKLNLH